MIRLFASCKLVLLVARKSDENCNLDEVAPLVARKLATLDMTEVMSEVLTDDIVTAPALPRLMLELTLNAAVKFNELIDIDPPESPLVDIYTFRVLVPVENKLNELNVSLLKLFSDFCNSLNSEA
jgi:hypothetical protein